MESSFQGREVREIITTEKECREIVEQMRTLEKDAICEIYFKAKEGIWDERMGEEPPEEKKRGKEQAVMAMAKCMAGCRALVQYGYRNTPKDSLVRMIFRDEEECIRRMMEHQALNRLVEHLRIY